MKIVVTADHVRAGEIRSCVRCPIALAVLDALRVTLPKVRLLVQAANLYVSPGPWRDWVTVRLPDAARTFIREFDAGRTPAPFEFELPIDLTPDPTNTPAAIAA